jgi:hypothetical protein
MPIDILEHPLNRQLMIFSDGHFKPPQAEYPKRIASA